MAILKTNESFHLAKIAVSLLSFYTGCIITYKKKNRLHVATRKKKRRKKKLEKKTTQEIKDLPLLPKPTKKKGPFLQIKEEKKVRKKKQKKNEKTYLYCSRL